MTQIILSGFLARIFFRLWLLSELSVQLEWWYLVVFEKFLHFRWNGFGAADESTSGRCLGTQRHPQTNLEVTLSFGSLHQSSYANHLKGFFCNVLLLCSAFLRFKFHASTDEQGAAIWPVFKRQKQYLEQMNWASWSISSPVKFWKAIEASIWSMYSVERRPEMFMATWIAKIVTNLF